MHGINYAQSIVKKIGLNSQLKYSVLLKFGVYHADGVAGLARLAKPKALLSRRVWDAEVVTLWA